jgi:enolase-like protein
VGAQLRRYIDMPLATNTAVINFEQLGANIHHRAFEVVLLDTTFWGGIRACIKAAGVCETFQLGVAVHSSGELGIQLATMLHLGAVLPNLTSRPTRITTISSTTSSSAASSLIATARSRFPTVPASASRSTATSSDNTRRSIAGWAAIPITAIPAAPLGIRWCRIRIGRIRPMSVRRRG